MDIVKVQKETMTPIAGAKFIHTMPDGSREEVMTDGQGKAALKGLIRGEHMVEESFFVPDGYTKESGKIRFQISGNNQIELKENTSTVQNGKKYSLRRQ